MTILLCYDCLSTRKKWSKSVSTCVRWWLSLERGRMANTYQYKYKQANTNVLNFHVRLPDGTEQIQFGELFKLTEGLTNKFFLEIFFLLFKDLTDRSFFWRFSFFFLKVWPTSVLGSSSEPESTGLLFSSCQDHMKHSDLSTLPGTHCGREKTTRSWSPW